ncbi:MAG: hypothetical protein JNM88_09750 [Chitinophagaceae bacterium]|nr:hypothetical protein [Chitinophagaceae bacterium]
MNSDYSCYVEIHNNTNQDIKLTSSNNNHGNYTNPPPPLIEAGIARGFILEGTNWGPFGYGADGDCTYQFTVNGKTYTYKFSYRCPHLANDNSIGVEMTDTNVQSVIVYPDPVPTSGHPLNITIMLNPLKL